MNGSTPAATIAIVTKDRRDQLRDAIASALMQEGDVEVLVVDDGSSDGTADMVRAEFPQARVERFPESAGLVVRRNDAARLARGDHVFSIDDDALFTTPRIVVQTLAEFADPRVGAVGIPLVDVHYGPEVLQLAPDADVWVAPSFRGGAHALRRDVFLALGGYREAIVHQGEEADFSLRMLGAGYVVRLGRADPIHHYESPSRSRKRMTMYGRRNEMLLAFTYMRAPWNLVFVLHWGARGVVNGVRIGLLATTLRGFLHGARLCWRLRHERRPLARDVLKVDRRLRRAGRLPLRQVGPALPPPAQVASSAYSAS